MARTDPFAARRRKIRKYLVGLREKAGVSQRGLANTLGLEYYTFVSQVENGYAKVPEWLIIPWADAVRADRTEFCISVLEILEPGYAEGLKPVFALWKQKQP